MYLDEIVHGQIAYGVRVDVTVLCEKRQHFLQVVVAVSIEELGENDTILESLYAHTT